MRLDPLLPLLLPPVEVINLLLREELLHPRNGLKHEGRTDHAELEQIAAMQDEIAVQVFLRNLPAFLLDEGPNGQVHLTIAHKGVVLDVQIPHLHEILLALVDVGELVDHPTDFGHEPRRVDDVLRRRLENSVRRHGQVRGGVVIQPVVTRHERSVAVIRPVEVIKVSGSVQEFGKAVVEPRQAVVLIGLFGLADEDVGDGGSLDGPVSGKGVSGRLADEVVRVAHVSGVVQLGDGDVDAGALGNGLQKLRKQFR